ncbi:transporter substrate-binding domain-containing protein [Thalassotalea sp. G2M2-11]|uniref:substrate-binding periplasmic protein n=1 Tax=Thalassotalea sp. G2M2-11 TaxID=2787627 RepID=UPI0019D15D8C|nr:transporter substrate-binding domain-containing protein [Thalassotalea sp. G2M2-11]
MRLIFWFLLSFVCITPLEASEQPISFCYEEWEPYSFIDENNQAVGVSVDYLKYKLTLANMQYKFSELPFPRCMQLVKSGKIDFILHVDENDNLQLIKQPIADWELTFAVSDKNPMSFEQLMQSKGLNVLVARSYVYPAIIEEKLQQMSANVIKVSFYTDEVVALKRLFHRLTVGQGQAMVVDRVWAEQMIKKHHLPIKLFDQLLVSIPQYIGYIASNKRNGERLSAALSEP